MTTTMEATKQDVVGYAKSMATYGDNEWHEQWREHYKEHDKAEQSFCRYVGQGVRQYNFKRINRDTFACECEKDGHGLMISLERNK